MNLNYIAPGTPVEVVWLDTTHHSGWKNREDLDALLEGETLRQRSVGYFLRSTERYIAICMDQGETNDSVGDIQQFPCGVLESVTELKAVEAEVKPFKCPVCIGDWPHEHCGVCAAIHVPLCHACHKRDWCPGAVDHPCDRHAALAAVSLKEHVT